MKEFFSYSDSIYDHKLNFLEWMIPLMIVYTIIILIVIYRNKLVQSEKLDFIIRTSLGSVSIIILILHYALQWAQNGLTIHNLPLDLTSINLILCIILVFGKNKRIFNFVVFLGVIGGLIKVNIPVVDTSFYHFRYYFYMFSNSIIVLVPLYFLIVYGLIPTFKDTLKFLGIMQIVVVTTFIFNAIFNTTYMKLVFGSNPSEVGTPLYYLGDWPLNVILLEILGITLSFICYGVIQLCYPKESEQQPVNPTSAYMTKKKEGRFSQ